MTPARQSKAQQEREHRRNVRLARQVAFIECRTIGHQWEQQPNVPEGWARPARVIFRNKIVLRCLRCTMDQVRCLDDAGNVVMRWYSPPEGYRLARNATPGRREMRLVMARRR